jgi:hypothetical protein
MKHVVRITELIRFKSIRIIALKGLLDLSEIQALFELACAAVRVLAQLLWACGLQRKFACLTTIIQSKRPALKSTSCKNAK